MVKEEYTNPAKKALNDSKESVDSRINLQLKTSASIDSIKLRNLYNDASQSVYSKANKSDLSKIDVVETTLSQLYGETVYHTNKSLNLHQKNISMRNEKLSLKNQIKKEQDIMSRKKFIKKVLRRKVKDMVVEASRKKNPNAFKQYGPPSHLVTVDSDEDESVRSKCKLPLG